MGRKHPGRGQRLFICFAVIATLFLGGCAAFEAVKGSLAAREYLNRSSELLAAGNYQEAIEENQRVLSMSVDNVPKDQAAFNIALIYAHNENPGKDYRKSLGYFKTLLKEYPESPLREQAGVWADVISTVQKASMKPEENDNPADANPDGKNNPSSAKPKEKRNEWKIMNERVASNLHLLRSQKLFSEGKYREVLDENSVLLDTPGKSPFRDRALFNMGLVYAHQDNPDKDYAKSLSYFTKLINEYPDSPLAVEASIWRNVLNVIEKAKQVDLEIEQKKKELSK